MLRTGAPTTSFMDGYVTMGFCIFYYDYPKKVVEVSEKMDSGVLRVSQYKCIFSLFSCCGYSFVWFKMNRINKRKIAHICDPNPNKYERKIKVHP